MLVVSFRSSELTIEGCQNLKSQDMYKGKRGLVEEEEDEEPIQIVESDEPNDDTVSMCLLGKLWMNRSYNMFGLMETMKKLWGPSQGVNCREMGHNLISFQFKNRRDLKRVLAMEPWHFNKHVLVLKQFTGNTQPSAMQFDSTPFWMRVYDLPMVGSDEKILKQIGSRFGEVVEIDHSTMAGVNRSVRLKIMLKLDQPLKRGTKIKIGKAPPCWIPVTYERIPSFCYYCGKLGHTCKDCPNVTEKDEDEGVINEAELPYGDWMRASPMKVSQNFSERQDRGVDRVRQNLFKSVAAEEEQKILATDDSKNANQEQEMRGMCDQVSELLSGLQKVEVSSSQHVTITTEQQKVEDTPKIVESPDTKIKLSKANHTLNQKTNIIHPTTKTVIHQPKSQVLDKPNQPKPPEPDPITKLIPISELISMVHSTSKLFPSPSTGVPLNRNTLLKNVKVEKNDKGDIAIKSPPDMLAKQNQKK